MTDDLGKPRWRPHANQSILARRAELLAHTRKFFAQRDVLEVETPVLSQSGIQDPNIHSVRAKVTGVGDCFLHTSPELHMKRMLAAGTGDIYQVCKVFRDAELGAKHSVEFTLVEWYRKGFSLEQLMQETVLYCESLLNLTSVAHYTSYSALFDSHLKFDPISIKEEELRHLVTQSHGDELEVTGLSKIQMLDFLLTSQIEPRLPKDRLTCVYDYPAEQAALAQFDEKDNRLAKRFEVFCGPVELANGYLELLDVGEQKARFDSEALERRKRGLAEIPMDHHFLEALEEGLPPCAGVAVGFDRLLMLRCGVETISQVLTFPLEKFDDQ